MVSFESRTHCGSIFLNDSDPTRAALRKYLSAHLRQSFDQGQRLTLTSTSPWEEWARARQTTAVPTKVHRLLELAGRYSPGEWQNFTARIFAPLLDARDEAEIGFYVDHLQRQGLIETRKHETHPNPVVASTHFQAQWRLTIDGWEAIAPTAPGGRTGVGFVAMSFAPTLIEAYEEGIRAAVEDDCGLHAIRVDRVEHNDQITDRILAGIRSAQFTVADFTGQRPGVYFEAGFAMALGRTVIWCCRKDEEDRVHFDTRQFNHIFWTDTADLRQKLAARIRATVSIPARP